MTIIIIGIILFLLVISFMMGMASGYYLALYNLGKPELLALGAFGFAFLTWIGSGTSLAGLIRDWYKDRRQEDKIPKIKYGDLIVKKRHGKTHGQEYDVFQYYLRIKVRKGEGMANEVHAFMDVPALGIRHLPATWSNGPLRSISIGVGIEEDLHLFTIESHSDSKRILWHTQDDYMHEIGKYDSALENQVIVKLVTSNGKVPDKDFNMTIEEIIEKSKEV